MTLGLENSCVCLTTAQSRLEGRSLWERRSAPFPVRQCQTLQISPGYSGQAVSSTVATKQTGEFAILAGRTCMDSWVRANVVYFSSSEPQDERLIFGICLTDIMKPRWNGLKGSLRFKFRRRIVEPLCRIPVLIFPCWRRTLPGLQSSKRRARSQPHGP